MVKNNNNGNINNNNINNNNNSVFVQYEMSSPAAGDYVDNVLHRHRAAVQIQRWFRLLAWQQHNNQISTSEQSVRWMLDAKRQELLRQRTLSSSASEKNDDRDYQRQKEDKARLARQQAIQVCLSVTYLLFCVLFTQKYQYTCGDTNYSVSQKFPPPSEVF